MLLLDTHAIVWLASDLSQLSPRVQERIRKNAGCLYVSSISALEITLLVKRGRLTLPLNPHDFFEKTLHQHGIKDFPITWEITSYSASLPPIHNDPFDRLILATARIHNMTIISRDNTFHEYPGVKILWG